MIWLLLACTSGGDKSTTGNENQPTAEVVTTDDTGPPPLPTVTATGAKPSLSPDEVARLIETAWSTPPDPGEIVDTYMHLMSLGDGVCPGDLYSITDIWLYGCIALNGYTYAGVSEAFFERVSEQGFEGNLSGVSGDFWIDTDTGSTLEGGGHVVSVTESNIWIAEMAGSWRWDEGSDPLAHGFSGNLWIEFIDDFAIQVRGAADISGVHVAAHNFVLSAYCDYGPAGKLSLRDPGGGWYSMSFEGCEPCTEVTFQGEDLGEACIDMSGMVSTLKGRL